MKISVRQLIAIAIFFILYTGFQGGRYFLANRIQELGLLFALTLFAAGATITAFNVRDKDLRWSWWVFATLVFVAYTFILPAVLFSQNAGVPVAASIFASREFLVVFLAPSLYFLYRAGYEVEKIESIVVTSLTVLMLSYLFHYFRMDLPAAYFSSDYTLSSLVTFDPWRGYRLKTPSFGFYLLTIIAPMMIFRAKGFAGKTGWLLLTVILGYIWILVSQRSMAASLLMAVLCYHFFFARKERLGLFFFVLPIMVTGIYVGVGIAFDHLSKLDPETDGVRFKSYMIAWESIKEHPLFGFGQQSNKTLTEQDIFWYKFFSADLGLIGITFKYGFVGALVYIVFSIYLIKRMITTNWLYRSQYGDINIIIFTLMIVYIAFTINIALTPAFTYIPGLTAASLGIGLTAIWQHKIKSERAALYDK
ncbi:MAG: O-antigen ligase family protein [Pontibacterium sp.]